MKTSRHVLLFLFIFLCGLLSSCERKKEFVPLSLPPTPLLSSQQRFGIVTSSHLRLRKEPGIDTEVLTTIWNPRNVVFEILSQTSVKEEIDGRSGYWLQVSYDGLSGWVFGGHVEIFASRDDALRKARERS